MKSNHHLDSGTTFNAYFFYDNLLELNIKDAHLGPKSVHCSQINIKMWPFHWINEILTHIIKVL